MRNEDKSHRTQLFPHLGQKPGFPDLEGRGRLPVYYRGEDSVDSVHYTNLPCLTQTRACSTFSFYWKILIGSSERSQLIFPNEKCKLEWL